jgi:hypothetical protein
MAINSQGIQFIWTNGTAACTTAMDSTGAVGEIKSISGPAGSANVIDCSNLGSTAKEKQMGLPDEGSITLEVNFGYTTSANDKQKDMIADRKARTKRQWGILFPDASSSLARGDGYCTGFAITGSVDNILSANITVEIDGPVTWTT